MKLNNLDLNRLTTFMLVAQSGGVAKAAKTCFLTPSAISQSLSGLERQLGVRLFDRVGKRMILNPAGQKLFSVVVGSHEQLGVALRDIERDKAEISGVVRVGMFLGFSQPAFSSAIARLLITHSKVSVRYLYAAPSDFESMLWEGKVDMAVSFLAPCAKTQVRGTRLWRQALVLVRATADKLVDDDVDALLSRPFVDYYHSSIVARRWFRHHFGVRGVDLNIRAFAASARDVMELVQAGVGLGVVPRELALPEVRAGRIAIVRPRAAPLEDWLWLLEPRVRTEQRAVAALRATLCSAPFKSP